MAAAIKGNYQEEATPEQRAQAGRGTSKHSGKHSEKGHRVRLPDQQPHQQGLRGVGLCELSA